MPLDKLNAEPHEKIPDFDKVSSTELLTWGLVHANNPELLAWSKRTMEKFGNKPLTPAEEAERKRLEELPTLMIDRRTLLTAEELALPEREQQKIYEQKLIKR